MKEDWQVTSVSLSNAQKKSLLTTTEHNVTMACPNRPMEQLAPSREISDGESNLVAR